ncbi:plastocyanin/azurin family copper-binding protein [Halopseudomonas phragmitis]|uniref:Plastocyanin n=2 Tax=Pseudomonadaceae TaxID=135621 RepID=A0A1V0B1X9_9GAMM|nr:MULTISPECIES: cupredoxin family protein [Pseudomonadaceae]AQZ93784.1 plastocyanin [Halopseudomonas phragmitis]PAU85735.1 plastocyanin [Pseudomonas sp. WN033]RHW19985.1 plastocyanin [Pseudomonas jilinensis]
MHNSLLSTGLAMAISLASLNVLAHGPAHHGERPQLPPEQTAWGIAGDESAVDREVVIRMDDRMRFYPDHLEVREGETLRLVIRNEGQLLHELVLGSAEELAKHAEMMAQFPDMEHDEPWMAHVDPGQSQTLIWTFNRSGRFEFACLLPGHYQAGMLGALQVSEPKLARHNH